MADELNLSSTPNHTIAKKSAKIMPESIDKQPQIGLATRVGNNEHRVQQTNYDACARQRRADSLAA
jgi:hypothetical protein